MVVGRVFYMETWPPSTPKRRGISSQSKISTPLGSMAVLAGHGTWSLLPPLQAKILYLMAVGRRNVNGVIAAGKITTLKTITILLGKCLADY